MSPSGRNYTLAVRFKAAAMGLPFLPARSHARHRHVPPQRRQGDRLPVHRREAGGHAGPVPRRGRHPRPRGRPLRQLPHPRHDRRRPRPGPGREAAHHHLRAADPARRDPPRPDADGHPVLLRRCGLRGAVRQLPGQHAVRVLLRRGPPAAVAGGGEGPGGVPAVPGRVRLRRARTSPSTCSAAAGCARLQELRRQEFCCCDRGTA